MAPGEITTKYVVELTNGDEGVMVRVEPEKFSCAVFDNENDCTNGPVAEPVLN